ncbi:uncharacterized protein LOC131935050 [Physella acuta]|uniref:uncharacterized protein LOC131935050 n=1 Tax=Physella acuta TaxID=109671 RepID=UPI0027DB8E52|nr:uncharacterized protein LOC131935050 [Physella acuta]
MLLYTYVAVVVMTCTSLLLSVAGSRIELSTTPEKVVQGLTSSVSLRCSLLDTTDVTSAPEIELESDKGEGRCNQVTDTVENIQNVISVTLSKVGMTLTPLATVSVFSPPVSASTGNLTVTGHVKGEPGKARATLEVTWDRVTLQEHGVYACEIHALTSAGRLLTFASRLELDVVSPTVSELLERLEHVQAEVKVSRAMTEQALNATKEMKQRVRKLESSEQASLSELKETKAKVAEIQRNIHDLDLARQELQNGVSDLNATVTLGRGHVEQGLVRCGHSIHDWVKDNSGGKFSLHPVTFSQSYPVPPAVMIAPVQFWIGNYQAITFGLETLNVTATGFVLRCYMVNQVTDIDHLNVRWLSTAL